MKKHTSQPINQWKRSLTLQASSRDKELSNSAWNRRLTLLEKFSKFAGKNPNELLAQEPMDIHEKLMEWFVDLKKNVSFNSARNYIASVRGFFSHNGIHFPRGCRLPDIKASKITKTYNETDVWEIDDEGNIHGFNNLLPQFLSNLSFREKAVALCLLTSAQDTKDLLELNVDFMLDLKGESKKGSRIYWDGSRQKDGIGFKTFIGKEATAMLRLYLEQERAGAKPDDPLFVKVIDTEKDADGKRIISRTYGRLEVQDVRNAFAFAAKKMGINGDNGNPFRPKRFRHIFRTACSHAKIDSGFCNAFMGHKTNVSDGYLNKSRAQLTAAYSEVEYFLTVFGENGKTSLTEIRELVVDKVGALKQELTERDAAIMVLTSRLDIIESDAKWMGMFIEGIIDDKARPLDVIYEEVQAKLKAEEDEQNA